MKLGQISDLTWSAHRATEHSQQRMLRKAKSLEIQASAYKRAYDILRCIKTADV